MINKLCFCQLFPDGHLDVVLAFFTASIWLSDISLQLDGRTLSDVIEKELVDPGKGAREVTPPPPYF